MARIFRIKNKTLRWLAGLIALFIESIWGFIKMSLFGVGAVIMFAIFICVGGVIVVGIGTVARYLLGIFDASLLEATSHYGTRIFLGFFAFCIGYVLIAVVPKIIKIPAQAKKYGNRLFNSIGDKNEEKKQG